MRAQTGTEQKSCPFSNVINFKERRPRLQERRANLGYLLSVGWIVFGEKGRIGYMNPVIHELLFIRSLDEAMRFDLFIRYELRNHSMEEIRFLLVYKWSIFLSQDSSGWFKLSIGIRDPIPTPSAMTLQKRLLRLEIS